MRAKRTLTVLAMTVAGLWLAPAGAQTYQAPRQANGLPDWGGLWARAKGEGSSIDPAVADGAYATNAPFTPQARAAYEAIRKARDEGKPAGEIGCLPSGSPRVWRANYPIEFVVTPGVTYLLYEFKAETRRVYTDGRKPPSGDDLELNYNGFSSGRWEGDALVFDTVGLKAHTIDADGLDHSDALTLHERIRRTSPDTMEVAITMTDPKTFTRPWTVTRHYSLRPGWTMGEFVCAGTEREH